MKSKYSKVVFSDDTIKKVDKIRKLKAELAQVKYNKAKFEEKRAEAKAYIDSISYREMEVIGHILGDEIPQDYFKKGNEDLETE